MDCFSCQDQLTTKGVAHLSLLGVLVSLVFQTLNSHLNGVMEKYASSVIYFELFQLVLLLEL